MESVDDFLILCRTIELLKHAIDLPDGHNLDLGVDLVLGAEVDDGLRGLDAANAAALFVCACGLIGLDISGDEVECNDEQMINTATREYQKKNRSPITEPT